MSRAFVNEDAGQQPEPRYSLPEADSPYYPEAAAWALIQGADIGNTGSAEAATGYRWGDPDLVEYIRKIEVEAEARDDVRVAQLARRYVRAARRRPTG